MSDPSVAGVDEWDGGVDSPLSDVADLTLEDVRREDLPALAAAVTMVLADLDNPARYGGSEPGRYHLFPLAENRSTDDTDVPPPA